MLPRRKENTRRERNFRMTWVKLEKWLQLTANAAGGTKNSIQWLEANKSVTMELKHLKLTKIHGNRNLSTVQFLCDK